MKKQKSMKKKEVTMTEYRKEMNKIIKRESGSLVPDVFYAMLNYASTVKIKDIKN